MNLNVRIKKKFSTMMISITFTAIIISATSFASVPGNTAGKRFSVATTATATNSTSESRPENGQSVTTRAPAVVATPFLATTGTFTIVPADWSIDGTPEHNSSGFNAALEYAAQAGYAEIIFPNEEFMISEYQPVHVQNLKDVTIDMNGATLKMNPNGLRKNKIMTMADCRNVTLKNGTLLGDIEEHDYDTNPGTTEGNLGIEILGGCVDSQLDHMIIKDITGWGIVTSKGKDYTSRAHVVSKTNLQTGGIDLATGVRKADSTKICTINPIDISEFDTFEDKYFILGVDKGYGGYPYLSARKFDVIFYDSNYQIISSLSDQSVYKKIPVPDDIAYADFVFYQSNLPISGDGDFNHAVIFIGHLIQPTNFYITNTTIDNCRSLGIAVCGGDNLVVEDCTIKNIASPTSIRGGIEPGYAVNMEDGWEYMNEIKLINNNFENNSKDLVVCAGDRTVVSGNTFNGMIWFYDRSTNNTFKNNIIENSIFGWPTQVVFEYPRYGDLDISGNTYIKKVNVVLYEKYPNRLYHDAVDINFTNETFINANLMGMPKDIELTNSTISSDQAESVWFRGTYRNCNFDLKQGLHESAKMYDCFITGSGSINSQKDTLYDGCTIQGTIFRTQTNTTSIMVNNCDILDSTFSIANWGACSEITIQNSNVNMQTGIKPLIESSAGKTKKLLLANNIISNQINQPVIKMFDTTYAIPNGIIYLEGNTFMQTSFPYLYDGVMINSGTVYFYHQKNQFTGAELLNPIYIGNRHFIISNNIPSDSGS